MICARSSGDVHYRPFGKKLLEPNGPQKLTRNDEMCFGCRCELQRCQASDTPQCGRLTPRRRCGRSGLAAAIFMTPADLPRVAACARRFLSCSSVSQSLASVSMNKHHEHRVHDVPDSVLAFHVAAGSRTQAEPRGGITRPPSRISPCRRTRSLRRTAGSMAKRVSQAPPPWRCPIFAQSCRSARWTRRRPRSRRRYR